MHGTSVRLVAPWRQVETARRALAGERASRSTREWLTPYENASMAGDWPPPARLHAAAAGLASRGLGTRIVEAGDAHRPIPLLQVESKHEDLDAFIARIQGAVQGVQARWSEVGGWAAGLRATVDAHLGPVRECRRLHDALAAADPGMPLSLWLHEAQDLGAVGFGIADVDRGLADLDRVRAGWPTPRRSAPS